MLYSIEPTQEADVIHVGNNLRQADINEIHAFGMPDPMEAALYSFDMSPLRWTGKCDGEPFCIFGVSPRSVALGHGSPWLLGTDKILQHQFAFLRKSGRMVDVMQARYPLLTNYVHEDNHVSKRWLKWLGFEVGDAVRLGLRGSKFHHFTRGKI